MRQVALLICFSILGCNASEKISNSNLGGLNTGLQYMPGPQALIYKTKNDYRNNVPVLLSEDKSEIISYPHPSDIKVGIEFQLPTMLKNGYLLDNRGLGNSVAFLKYTYKEYSELMEVPSLDELYNLIIDKDPILELYDCGNITAFTDIEKQLNEIIEKDKLRKTCKAVL